MVTGFPAQEPYTETMLKSLVFYLPFFLHSELFSNEISFLDILTKTKTWITHSSAILTWHGTFLTLTGKQSVKNGVGSIFITCYRIFMITNIDVSYLALRRKKSYINNTKTNTINIFYYFPASLLCTLHYNVCTI